MCSVVSVRAVRMICNIVRNIYISKQENGKLSISTTKPVCLHVQETK